MDPGEAKTAKEKQKQKAKEAFEKFEKNFVYHQGKGAEV